MIEYPPFIENTIPAFISSQIRIPFTQNPAVGFKEVMGFSLIIKEYSTSQVVATIKIINDYYENNDNKSVMYNEELRRGEIVFNISNPEVIKKQYYKF